MPITEDQRIYPDELLTGCFSAPRDLYSNPIFSSELQAAIFISLLAKAAWETCVIRTRYGDCHLERGESIVSQHQLAEQYRLQRSAIRRLLKKWERVGLVAIDNSRLPKRAGIVIAVLSYEYYPAAGGAGDYAEAEQLAADPNDLGITCRMTKKRRETSPVKSRRSRETDVADRSSDLLSWGYPPATSDRVT